MPQRRRKTTTVDTLLEQKIEQAVANQVIRLLGGPSAVAELKRVPGGLQRLERRLETLAGKIGGARTAGRKSTTGRPGRPPIHTTCTLRGCSEPHYAKGLCSKHYQRARRAEEAEPTPKAPRTKKRTRRRKKKTKRS